MMEAQLEQMEQRYERLGEELAQPQVLSDPQRLREVSKARGELEEPVLAYRELKAVRRQLGEAQALLRTEREPDLLALAQEEVRQLEGRERALQERLSRSLLPREPDQEKDVIMEIRAGAGGEEAALFAADLFRMYGRYAESRGWKVEMLSRNLSGVGGFKEVIFSVSGKGSYPTLRHESGVHRVQRVPVTEASGRIHTSTATVAVLPEAEEVEVHIEPEDLRIQTFRASTAGGQHMQKNETAVRVVHLPSGIVATCQDERSQHQNKEKAIRVLRAHLLEGMRREQREQIAQQRRAQVGTGERSEKIRTYNFPQNRVTDHRLRRTWHNLQAVLDGGLEPIVSALREAQTPSHPMW